MTAMIDFFESTSSNWRARLNIATDLMRELSRYTDPEGLFTVFSRRMAQLYPTTRQLTMNRRGLEYPNVRITRFNLWSNPANPHTETDQLPVVSGGMLAELIYSQETKIIDDLIVPEDDPAAEFLQGQRSLLAIPLYENGSASSMVVCTREESNAFERNQVPELVWMCNMFSRAMQTLVLTERLQAAYDAADYELQSVAEMQRNLLPKALPQLPGLDIAVHCESANLAGGDYYDFFPLPNDRLGVLLADVSGHGTAAAVLLAITHCLAHTYPEPPSDPGRFLAYLNSHLGDRYTGSTGSFVTAVYAVLDLREGTVRMASAGHPPPRKVSTNWGEVQSIDQAHSLPLGVREVDKNYPEVNFTLQPGERLAFYTDGIVEAVNSWGDPFGFDRLDAALAWDQASSSGLLSELIARLDRFTGSPPTDDRTVVILSRQLE